MMRRRAALAALGLAGLSGCGFRPLYDSEGRLASQRGGTVSARLDGIYVALIPNREGQLLRQALQERLDSDDASSKRYTLSVSYALDAQPVSIQTTNASTRTRVVGRAQWTLSTVATPPAVVTSGNARALDGFNVLDEQYFFSVLSNEAVQRRMADLLADQITQRLAVYFRDAA